MEPRPSRDGLIPIHDPRNPHKKNRRAGLIHPPSMDSQGKTAKVPLSGLALCNGSQLMRGSVWGVPFGQESKRDM